MCHLHFGELFEDERNFSHAREEYKLAYDALKQLGESYYWLEACLPLTNVCILLGEEDDARRYLQEAEAEAQRINNKEHMAKAYVIHYELALLEGNSHDALDYYIKSDELEDSVFGLEKREEMRRQRLDYEHGIKMGEMDTLNQDITHLKRVRNMMIIFALLLTLMAGAIIAALVYAMRVRNRTQRMLRQVEETRSLFFTNVVHQLRTPLTAIMGATDNIVATDASDVNEQRKNVEIIERQGKNLLELVDRILQVGSVRSALREPDWRTGDAVTFVHMVVESYRERCKGRHIELTYTSSEPSITIDTVPLYLKTILGSYIENAINYSKDFSKISIISFVEKDKFVIKVNDDGMGIAEADLPHVFEPFFGLTVARDMAMAMGGEVSATSVKDQGSCFTLRLPLKHGSGVKERLEYAMEPVTKLVRRRIAYESAVIPDAVVDDSLPVVLVVEDHADVAHLVGNVLSGYYTVLYANDGEQALSKMRQQRPDVVITDVKMPKMDGLELCRQVRASSDLRSIPIILLSARTADADRVRGIKAGADAYLVKPFVAEELLAWVHRLMESHSVLMDDSVRACQDPDVREASPDAEPCCCSDSDDVAMFLDRFKQEVEKQMAVGFKLDYDKLALSLKMGESKMRRRVQQLTGKSMSSYIIQLRMERAMHLLKARPDMRVGDVAEQCGFVDVAYFSRVFRQHYGMTPTEARNS
jgi:signal transduction histidine kinase/DNA-binding response OmpR family regulator